MLVLSLSRSTKLFGSGPLFALALVSFGATHQGCPDHPPRLSETRKSPNRQALIIKTNGRPATFRIGTFCVVQDSITRPVQSTRVQNRVSPVLRIRISKQNRLDAGRSTVDHANERPEFQSIHGVSHLDSALQGGLKFITRGREFIDA